MVDHVVPKHELGAGGVFVERAQRGREVAVAIGAGVGVCSGRTDRREALKPAGVRIDLELDALPNRFLDWNRSYSTGRTFADRR